MVTLVVATMFLSVAGTTIGESGTSALFFDQIGPGSLPVMYLAQGAVGVVAMLLLSGALGRLDARRAYVMLPLLLFVVVAIERVILAGGPRWIYPMLYLTVPVAILIQAVYLWGVAGLVTDTRRAKRLFPLFGAGNILGAVIGGLLTKPLADAVGAGNLLVVWAATLLASSFLCAAIVRRAGSSGARRGRRRSAIAEIAEGFRYVRRSRLLVWMSVGSVLFSVLFYSLYLPYAQAATARFADPDALAGFFGIFWAAVTATAFLVAIFLTNRLVGWFGAATMVMVLPALYVGAFSILLVLTTFSTLVAIRFSVNVWLQGVASPSWETLTNVTPPERRDQVRAFLNGGPSQVGTAIAGLVALVGQDALTARQLSMIGLLVAVGTVGVTWMVRRSYTGALVDVIRSGRANVFDEPIRNAPIAIDADAQALSSAVGTLTSDDPRMRRLAVHVLDTASRDDDRVRPALRSGLVDGDAAVRASAVDALGRRSWLEPDTVRRALADADPAVRRAGVVYADDVALLVERLLDADQSVVAAAAARLLGGGSDSIAREAAARLLAGTIDERLAMLRALALAPAADAVEIAQPLSHDRSGLVRAAAFDVLGRSAAAVVVPLAVQELSAGDAAAADAALGAIDAVGVDGFADEVARVVEQRRDVAIADDRLGSGIAARDEPERLLRDALHSLAREEALVALSAASITATDRLGMRAAIDALRRRDAGDAANALEVIEVAGTSSVRPLISLWESSDKAPSTTDTDALTSAAAHRDPFIRACAELVRAQEKASGGSMTSPSSLSTMEMVLLLRPVELFGALDPADLEHVAAIAEERSFADGALIAEEGELGDEVHVVIEGNVRVARADGSTIAVRGAGDVIGELSLLRGSSRMASLFAEGVVRTISIQQRSFEAMIRERPQIALAIMRILADRLTSASGFDGMPQ